MFRRKVTRQLKEWKENYAPNYAAMLEGARRVGKSTAAEAFAKENYRSYIKVDFANITRELLDVFRDIADLDVFFLRLQAVTGTTLYKRESVIILDEIQLNPPVRQAIKYLVADGRYDYIETGSLISIKKNVKNIVIPSEEYRIPVYPMDYEEFLWATGNDSFNVLRELYRSNKAVGEQVNRKLMRDFRIYMAVGGMPQAVQAYTDGKNFEQIDRIKREIIDLYVNDFRKIDDSGLIGRMYRSVPSQLATKKKYYITKATAKQKTKRDIERMSDLIDSRTVIPCYNALNPGVTLSQTQDDSTYKIYLSDVGLFTSMIFESSPQTGDNIYNRLLSDRLPADLGYLYENAAAQMITSAGCSLYYHAWKEPAGNRYYEVDFILPHSSKLTVFEVKSSATRSHRSMDEFCRIYSRETGEAYLLSQKDVGNHGMLRLRPIYMLPFILEELSV